MQLIMTRLEQYKFADKTNYYKLGIPMEKIYNIFSLLYKCHETLVIAARLIYIIFLNFLTIKFYKFNLFILVNNNSSTILLNQLFFSFLFFRICYFQEHKETLSIAKNYEILQYVQISCLSFHCYLWYHRRKKIANNNILQEIHSSILILLHSSNITIMFSLWSACLSFHQCLWYYRRKETANNNIFQEIHWSIITLVHC